jgi:hypothetical protein
VPEGHREVLLDFSSLGFDTSGDVELLVDGKAVPYEGSFNYDRNFYRARLQLPPGKHTVSFREKVQDSNNIVSKVSVYAIPPGYPADGNTVIGAFATYNEGSSLAGYRPMDDACLMRDMTSREFCPPCTENMWRNFLREVSLIDGVARSGASVKASVLDLGADRLKVEWIDPQGKVRADLTGQLEWTPAAADVGRWKLRVGFVSDEVKDPRHTEWSVHTADFQIER